MAKQASINPTPEQSALRNIGRIRTLKLAIEKNQARGNVDKVADLQAELDRRMVEIDALRAELDTI